MPELDVRIVVELARPGLGRSEPMGVGEREDRIAVRIEIGLRPPGVAESVSTDWRWLSKSEVKSDAKPVSP